MIRRIDYTEIKTIYNERAREDFPSAERRPLSAIRKLYAQGRYTCLVLEEEGSLCAYATFLHDQSVDTVMLDLYAVDKNRRGEGIGSRFLAALREYWAEKKGILLECERPDATEDAAERGTRERRIDFYLRCGARMTPLRWRAFGVAYAVLYLPCRAEEGTADAAADLLALYALSVPALLRPFCLDLQEP